VYYHVISDAVLGTVGPDKDVGISLDIHFGRSDIAATPAQHMWAHAHSREDGGYDNRSAGTRSHSSRQNRRKALDSRVPAHNKVSSVVAVRMPKGLN
jgi:hypothetical protein